MIISGKQKKAFTPPTVGVLPTTGQPLLTSSLPKVSITFKVETINEDWQKADLEF